MRCLRLSVAALFIPVLASCSFGENHEIVEPPVPATWVEYRDRVQSFYLSDDGTGNVENFPFSSRGEDCVAGGSALVNERLLWELQSDGSIWLDLLGSRVTVAPKYRFGVPQWDTVFVFLCDDDGENGWLIFDIVPE